MILAAAAGLVGESGVFAAPIVTAEAVVEWKHEPRETLIVDEKLWRCSQTVCRGPVVETEHNVRRTCRLLARAGRLANFSTPAITLGAEELQRCNR